MQLRLSLTFWFRLSLMIGRNIAHAFRDSVSIAHFVFNDCEDDAIVEVVLSISVSLIAMFGKDATSVR